MKFFLLSDLINFIEDNMSKRKRADISNNLSRFTTQRREVNTYTTREKFENT